MMRALLLKLKEAVTSVLPVVLIVLLIAATPLVDLSAREVIVFCICSLFLIVGIALFNLGADLSMTPMGEFMGAGLTKSGNLKLLLIISFFMGLLITIAEPDLSVLAGQVSAVMNGTLLIVSVGLGVGLFLVIGVLKMIFKKSLPSLLMLSYLILFALASLLIENGKFEFLPLAYDSGGVTTGPITVPFIMALGVGIAHTIGGKDAGENSFGFIALCSVGPMLAVMLLALASSGDLTYTMSDYSLPDNVLSSLFETLLSTSGEVLKALGLIVIFFIAVQIFILKLPKDRLIQIAIGIAYTFLGLAVFLTSVSVGFMPIGFKLGSLLAGEHEVFLCVFAFVIGLVTVLAEPAVHVLNKQIEEVTGGTVTKRSMLFALSIGVGISILLSVIRVIYGFSVLYYLIPGYIISLMLSIFVPGIYTAIAFDSGGVASGPLTSSFILPFVIGACYVLRGESAILSLGFGVVAMVAMTPLITIQALGFKAVALKAVRERIVMKRILDADDEQIIYFE